MNSRLEDPKRDVQFSEGKLLTVCGGEATLEVTDDVIYMVIGVTAVFWQGACAIRRARPSRPSARRARPGKR